MPRIAQDRLCLCCEKRPIIGKPYSVYVCQECYLHGPLDDYDTVGRSLGHAKPCAASVVAPPSSDNERLSCSTRTDGSEGGPVGRQSPADPHPTNSP